MPFVMLSQFTGYVVFNNFQIVFINCDYCLIPKSNVYSYSRILLFA